MNRISSQVRAPRRMWGVQSTGEAFGTPQIACRSASMKRFPCCQTAQPSSMVPPCLRTRSHTLKKQSRSASSGPAFTATLNGASVDPRATRSRRTGSLPACGAIGIGGIGTIRPPAWSHPFRAIRELGEQADERDQFQGAIGIIQEEIVRSRLRRPATAPAKSIMNPFCSSRPDRSLSSLKRSRPLQA